MTKEGSSHNDYTGDRPLAAFELPGDLATFLAGEEYAMVTTASDQGTVFVVKASERDIAAMAERVPMRVSHSLHQHDLAPVIRTVVRIYDDPERPLALESFINVEDEQQWAEYASLAEQDEFHFLFYDQALQHRLTKQTRNTAGRQMSNILNWADRLKAAIPNELYDFDAAEAAVMATTRL